MVMNEFFKELASLQLQLPGSHTVDFNNDEYLLRLMNNRYPSWKSSVNPISIPIARLPRLFLHCDQLVEPFDNRYKNIETGERGEIKVYNALLESGSKSKPENCGMCVFPNVDGNSFLSREAKVEIDFVVVHPLKGVFVLSVKNTTTCKPEKIAKSMERHVNFIRLITDFNDCNTIPTNSIDGVQPNRVDDLNIKDGEQCIVPIHGLVLTFKCNINDVFDTCNKNEMRLIFQPEDMKDVQSKWQEVLASAPSYPGHEKIQKRIDLLTARLMVLTCIEGSLALIHSQISSNKAQEVYLEPKEFKKVLKNQFPNNPYSKDISDVCENFVSTNNSFVQKSKKKCKKKAVFLWTKEQISVIQTLTDAIFKSNDGCRMIVSGPRGSGKTLLIIFLAHLAKKVFHDHFQDAKDGDVVIRDGRFGESYVLFEKLSMKFQSSGIDVVRTYVDEKSHERRLIFFDEANSQRANVISGLKQNQHVLIFTSSPTIFESNYYKNYKCIQLTQALRASVQLTAFIEEFRCSDHLNHELRLFSPHFFEGSRPNIICVESKNEKDPEHSTFVDQCISTILENREKAKGLKEILLTPYVHSITLNRILSELQVRKINYQYRHPSDFLKSQFSKSKPQYLSQSHDSGYPKLVITTGNFIDGVEYGCVIVFLDRSLPCWWNEYIFDSMYIALTRATTHLSLVINNNIKPPMVFQKQSSSLQAYTPIILPPSHYSNKIEEIIKTSYRSKDPVIIFGNYTPPSNFRRIEDQEDKYAENESWFCGPWDKKVVVRPDLKSAGSNAIDGYMYDDLKKTYRFSALVIVCHSHGDYQDLCNSNVRHGLSYMFYEHKLSICPLYLITCFPIFLVSPRCDSKSICDFLCKKSNCVISDINDVSTEQESELRNPASWLALKEKGTSSFKKGDLNSALISYKESLSLLQKECDERVQIDKMDSLITIFDNVSELYTGISEIVFDIGQRSLDGDKDLRNQNVKESLMYAEKSIEINPCRSESYHRIAVANDYLESAMAAVIARVKSKYFSICDETEKMQRKRKAMLDYKMKNSVCWKLVKFKENVFMIDMDNDKGHFTSLDEAYKKFKNHLQVSFILNPGEYKSNEMFLVYKPGIAIDIVGNWDPDICPEKKCILEKSPVVITCSEIFTFHFFRNSQLTLSRVTLYQQDKHAVYSIDSHVILFQCFFRSTGEYASICCEGANSSLFADGCRSTDAYGSILATKKCVVRIQNSFFERTFTHAIELRDDVISHVDSCTIQNCGGPGISGLGCKLNIKSCSLNNNSFNWTIDVGSIQITECVVEIENTTIQNQIGHGIVIQHGVKGNLKNLNIQDCRNSGIYIGAPCTISDSVISKCYMGIRITEEKGDVILEDNKIEDCYFVVGKQPESVFPVVNGERWSLDSHGYDILTFEGNNDDSFGAMCYKKVCFKYETIQKAFEIWPQEYQSLDTKRLHGCDNCSVPVHLSPFNEEFLLCPYCEMVFYCNKKCYKEGKNRHSSVCKSYVKVLKVYQQKSGTQNSRSLDEIRSYYRDPIIQIIKVLTKGVKL